MKKFFGWLFVLYPIIIILLPIIAAIVMTALGIEVGEGQGPASKISILMHSGAGSVMIYSLVTVGLIVGLLCPAIIFISGFLLLNNKKNGINLAVIGFATDLIFRLLFIVMGYFNVYIQKLYFSAPSRMLAAYAFLLMDLLIIYYLSAQKKAILK